MTDRDRVIGTLNAAIDIAFGTNCELAKIPVDIAVHAVDLLKEQEPVKPVDKWNHGFYYACGSCWEMLGIVREYPSYCPCCGKKVKWDD